MSLTVRQLSAVHDKCRQITKREDFWNDLEKCIGEHVHEFNGIRYTFEIMPDFFMKILREEII